MNYYSFVEPAPAPSSNAWEKPISQALKVESSVMNGNQPSVNTKGNETSEVSNRGQHSNETASLTAPLMNTSAALLDGTSAPIETLVFENTSFKANSSKSGVSKMTEVKKETVPTVSSELNKEMTMSFGKVIRATFSDFVLYIKC